MLFRGCATALITPFKNNKIDFDALENMIESQLSAGIKGFVSCGTTGEPATMSAEECDSVVQFVINKVNHRAVVIAGAGSNCTAHAVENARKYQAMGADGVLIVTPYYNKCTQKGLVAHYQAICQAVDIPVVAYNVPGRTGVNIQPSTYDELIKIPNMAAIKEASSNYLQINEIARKIRGKMSLYSGDDEMVVPFYPMGGAGVISVASNVIPEIMVKICALCEEEKYNEAQKVADQYAVFNQLLFCEVNPIPIKAAAALAGVCSGEIRLPLTTLEPEHLAKLKAEMQKLGLVK